MDNFDEKLTTDLTPPVQEAEIVTNTMGFPDAMAAIIAGKMVTRAVWNDTSEYGILADGWLTIHTQGEFHVWKVNDGDLNATDWRIL